MAEEHSVLLLDQFITAASELKDNKLHIKPKPVTAKNEDSIFLENISKFEKRIKHTSHTNQDKNINSVVHTGETDSSEDEEQRDFELRKYNQSGRDIRRLLVDSSSSNSYDSSSSSKWNPKVRPALANNDVQLPTNQIFKSAAQTTLYSDPIFGLRLVNPLISSISLQDRMKGRTAVSISRMKLHLAKLNPSDDWVFAGVIVSKVMKTSQKGNQFSIWTISDLKNDLKTVALFLFSDAHKNLWKTIQGSVVGVLNPTVMERKEKSKVEATFSVNNSDRIMIMGQSKDLGTCRSRKKSGDPCTAFVNKNRCEYCIYHVKTEYRKFSQRSDLQSSFVGAGLNALRNKVLGKNEVFYAGKSFTAVKAPSKRSTQRLRIKDEGILESLTSGVRVNTDINIRAKNLSKGAANKIDVSVSQRKKDLELIQKLSATPKQIKEVPCGKNRKIISRVPTNDIISNFDDKVEFDTKFELFSNKIELRDFDGTHSNSITLTESKNTASDVIAKLKLKKVDKMIEQTSSSSSKATAFDVGVEVQLLKNNFDDLNYDSHELKNDQSNHRAILKSSKLNVSSTIVREAQVVSSTFTQQSIIESEELVKYNKLRKETPNDTMPQLDKAAPHKTIDNRLNSNLPIDIPVLTRFSDKSIDLHATIYKSKVNLAKQNAIRYVQRHGPIAKGDPMNVKSTKRKATIRPDISTPASKKLKEIQANEFMTQRFKKIMAASSKHPELLQKVDDEQQEKYFHKMELKEKLEEKMLETFKVKCKAVKCLKCKYTSFSPSNLCKTEKHPLKFFDTVKKFFKCSNCNNRTVSLTVVPIEGCQKCSNGRWERCAMIAEHNVKTCIPLSIRGGEERFLGGCVTNASVNLMVCKKFNDMGGKYLSRGFIQMEKRHSALYKRVRSMLPRRESERRVHRLARHCDILSAVETRFSMMNMTFMKYIENNACCFIPGKVLDEFYKILSLIETVSSPPKTHELMKELRDISSMAMEHFDEHIAPSLKGKLEKNESNALFSFKNFFAGTRTSDAPSGALISAAKAAMAVQRSPKLFITSMNDQLRTFRRHTKSQRAQLTAMMQHMQKLTRRVCRQTVRIRAQQEQIQGQERGLQEHGAKLQEQVSLVVETKRRVDEWEVKFAQVSNELMETRESLQKLSQQQQYQQEHQQKHKKEAKQEPELQRESQQQQQSLLEMLQKEETDRANQTSGVDVLESIFQPFYMPNIKPREARVDFKFLKRQQENLLPIITQDRKRKKSVDCDPHANTDQMKKSRASIHCDYYIENLRDTLSLIIKENITNNISKSVIEDEQQYKQSDSPPQKFCMSSLTGTPNINFTSFLSTSLESLMRGPLNSIACRKRKMSADVDFN